MQKWDAHQSCLLAATFVVKKQPLHIGKYYNYWVSKYDWMVWSAWHQQKTLTKLSHLYSSTIWQLEDCCNVVKHSGFLLVTSGIPGKTKLFNTCSTYALAAFWKTNNICLLILAPWANSTTNHNCLKADPHLPKNVVFSRYLNFCIEFLVM